MKTTTWARTGGRSTARGLTRSGGAAVAVLTLAVGLSACGTIGEPSEPKTVTKTASPSEDATTEYSAEKTSEDDAAETAEEVEVEEEEADAGGWDDAGDTNLTFGETYEWQDGVTAKVSTPEAYQPDEYAAGGEGYDHQIQLTVTMTNDSDQVVDASYVSPTVTSGQRGGDEIFDGTMGGGNDSSLLPGRTISFDVAYGVDDPDDVVVEFAPSWDHAYAYWTSD